MVSARKRWEEARGRQNRANQGQQRSAYQIGTIQVGTRGNSEFDNSEFGCTVYSRASRNHINPFPFCTSFPLSSSLVVVFMLVSGSLTGEVDGSDSAAGPPNRLLFNITISFSHPFSRLSSAASRSNSSTRPERSVIDRSRFNVHCFFLTRKRAVSRQRVSKEVILQACAGPHLTQLYSFCASPL